MNDHRAVHGTTPGQAGNDAAPAAHRRENERPVLVYVILFLSMLQLATLAYVVFGGWSKLSLAMQTGVMPMSSFLASFIFPVLFVAASTLLFFMRKAGAYAFVIYFVWSVGKFISSDDGIPSIYDVLLTTCIVVYCGWLLREKRLR